MMQEIDIEDKAQYIETFAPKNRATLLKSKVVLPDGREELNLETIAGEWEIYANFLMPKSQIYELRLNNGHMGYFPSIIQASKTIAGVTYNEIFR